MKVFSWVFCLYHPDTPHFGEFFQATITDSQKLLHSATLSKINKDICSSLKYIPSIIYIGCVK